MGLLITLSYGLNTTSVLNKLFKEVGVLANLRRRSAPLDGIGLLSPKWAVFFRSSVPYRMEVVVHQAAKLDALHTLISVAIGMTELDELALAANSNLLRNTILIR